MKTLKRFAIVIAAIFALAVPALAEDVSLAWDAVVGASGYKVYRGSVSGTYGTPTVVTGITTHTITGLTPGVYYIAVTSYITGTPEVESEKSYEIRFVVKLAAPKQLRATQAATTSPTDTAAKELARHVLETFSPGHRVLAKR